MVFTTNLVKHLMDILQLSALLANQGSVKPRGRMAWELLVYKIASPVSLWAKVNSLL